MRILDAPPATHPLTPIKVAIVTGLSNPASCELSKAQRRWLSDLDVPDAWKVPRNFPFVETAQAAVGEPSLLSASVANGCQFLRSHRKRYQHRAEPHWEALLSSTKRLFVWAGSCGLQLVNTISKRCRQLATVEVLALGPVSWRHPWCANLTASGSRDWLSRMFVPRTDHAFEGLGHMDYWESTEVQEYSKLWLSSRISE